jgi:hypothetical protein
LLLLLQNSFESWLHPDRYKTTLCSYAGACTRKFCFFAHSAAELRQPASKQHSAAVAAGCNPELRLTKTASLDTTPSVGTPNSSSSNMSSSSAQALHAGWGSPMAVSVGNSAAAAAAAAAGMYVQQMHPMSGGTAVGIPVNSSIPAGSLYLPMYQLANQQQLITALVDTSNSSTLLPNPPGLSVVTAPQLAAAGNPAAAAAAAPMHVAGGLTGGIAGMQLSWDNSALAGLATLGTPMATDSGTFGSNSFLFDPTGSPATPLTAASAVSPVHNPMIALGSTASMQAANAAGSLQFGSLQHALDHSSQQNQNGQLRQQLLQHLINVQQQKQPQQQLQDAQIDLSNNWSLAAVDANAGLMLNLNQQPLQQSGLTAAQAWPLFSLQQQQQQPQQQQQQQQQEAFSGMDVQVLPGPQGFLPVFQGSVGQQDVGVTLTGTASAAATATVAAAAPADTAGIGSSSSVASEGAQQLQQQLGLLSFAMPQPA